MKQEWKTPLRIGAVLFGLYLAVHYWRNLSALAALALGASFPLMLGAVIALIGVFSYLFGWFPVDKPEGWIAFFICFGICFAVSAAVSAIKENAENRRLEDGLENLKKRNGGVR